MRNFFKVVLIAGGILAGVFIILLAAAAIIIPAKYPPAKLKSIAEEKLSETLKRKVTVDDVRFNILSGFEVTKLTIGNRPGWADSHFVSADDISVSYHLFPLLWGEVSLGEIKLNHLQILVEKRGQGQFNFSDMMGAESTQASSTVSPDNPQTSGKHKEKSKKRYKARVAIPVPLEVASPPSFFLEQAWADTAPSTADKPSKTALLIAVDSINIVDGKLIYLDESVSPAQKSELQDLNFKVKNISMEGKETSFTLATPFSYNGVPYQLAAEGEFRYFLSNQSLKDLKINGTLNGLGFDVTGSAQDLTENFSPDLDGDASLDMLKFSGLVPKSLASMPEGLSLTGSAKVGFHLEGSLHQGLKLSGTADGSDLAIQYKDLFVKPAQSPCKLVFTSVKGPNSYDLPSFQAIFQDWELDGSFHYANGISYSIELHSKDLPLKGLSTTVPRWKNLTIAGTVGLNLTASEQLNKLKTIKVNGQFGLKDLDVSDSNDPHFISDTSGTLTLHESKTHIPSLDMGLNLNGFGGAESVVANLNLATPVLSYSYAINMKNVAAQPVVDAGIIVYGNPAFNSYKNTVYGSANFNFKGVGTGLTTELIEKTLNGSGNFIIQNGKLKGLPAIKTINNVFKDKSDEIDFEAIVGTIAVKNRVAALTCNTEGKVGKISANGAINFDGYYAPQMLIKSDIHKEFIDSDAIKSQLPSMIRDQWNVDWAADSKGNIPIDFKLTGDASKTPGLSCLDLSRLIKNVTSHLGQQLQNSAQPIIQNLGSQLKKLF